MTTMPLRALAAVLGFLALFVATPSLVNADDSGLGTLSGRILDADTKSPLPFASVNLFRISKEDRVGEAMGGAKGNEDGTFSVKVNPGSYRVVISYVGYTTQEYTAFVKAGESVVVDGVLPSEGITFEPVQVTAKPVEYAEGSMLAVLRKGVAASEAITAEQISKTTDSNAAEVAQRVSGVSVVGGRYVFIRGMGERYSQTSVNGAYVSSPEPNKKVVPLDLFPTAVLDNMIVQKTYTPDMPAEFGGGVLMLNTKDYVESGAFKQSFSIGYNDQLTSVGYKSYPGSGTDWLGFGAGSRALPDMVRDASRDHVVKLGPNFTIDQIKEMGLSFQNVWTPRTGAESPSYAYSGIFSEGFQAFGKQAGFLISASLDNSFSSKVKTENIWTGDENPKRALQNVQSKREVLGGLNGSFGMDLRESDEIKVNLLYTQSAEDITNVKEGPDNNRGVEKVRIEEIGWVERGLFQGVLRGDHRVGPFGSRLSWLLSYSTSSRDEPDRRQNVYDFTSGEYRVGGAFGSPFTLLFGETQDDVRTQRLDYTFPISKTPERVLSSVKAGYMHSTRDRASEFRRFGFKRGPLVQGRPLPSVTLPAEEFLSPENVAAGFYILNEYTQPDDGYTADQKIEAAYGNLDVPFGTWLRASAGARYEENVQGVHSYTPAEPSTPGIDFERKDFDLLPAVNLTFTPNTRNNVRVAYSRTLNRPELRELAPFSWPDLESGYLYVGNPGLQSTSIRNADLRWELYPYPGEFLSLGVFYKRFEAPIIEEGLADSGGSPLKRPLNGNGAELFGFEGEMRLSFYNIFKALDWTLDFNGSKPSSALLPWNVLFNYSRLHSESDFSYEDGSLRVTPLKGQPDYSFNVGLFFQRSRWEGSLLFKQFGERLETVDRTSTLTRYEVPAQDLDLSLGYSLSTSTNLKLKLKNLLDQEIEFHTEGAALITDSYENGRSVSLTFTYEPPSAVSEE